MTTNTQQPELPTIDQTVLTELVREALHDNMLEITDWQTRQLHSGGSGSRVVRVTGEAQARGAALPWSIVVKFFDVHGTVSFLDASTDLDAWDYWKREWLAYQAPWLQNLPNTVTPPRCLGAADHPGTVAWVALEDLQHDDQRPWSLARFGTVARHLGAFNGAYLAGRAMPTDPWVSRNWLRGWTERAAPMAALLPTVADHVLVRQIFSDSMITEFLRLWEERHAYFEALDALPQTFCHLDVFPRNVFVRPAVHGEQSVAIDWAFCGRAAAGEELGALIGASLTFFEADPGMAVELESQCIEGYLDGLRDADWRGEADDVRFAALASLVLRFGVGALAPVLTISLDDTLHGQVEQIFGRPFDVILDNIRMTMQYQEQRMVEVRRLLASK